jgi:hypothetical protein
VPAQLVVITHINALNDPWHISARVVRCADAQCLGEFQTTCPAERPSDDLKQFSAQIEACVAQHATLHLDADPPPYLVPLSRSFENYLLRLEQLLAVRCAALDGMNPSFLSGEREIIGGNIRLCADQPANPTLRILLARTLIGLKKLAPAAVSDCRDEVTLLQRQKPLFEPIKSTIDKMLSDVYQT